MNAETSRSTGFLEFLAWVEINKKRLLLAAGGIVAVWFAIYVYQWHANQQEQAANQALLALRSAQTLDTNAPVAKAQDYLKVALEYPGTGAGERALLLAAGALFSEAKYKDAQGQFQKFLKDYPNSPLAAQAAYGVAACLDALNEIDQALSKYKEVAAQFSNNPVAGQAKLASARLYESTDKPQLARDTYDELLKVAGASAWQAEARARREALLQKHPDLAATNAPITVTTNAAASQPNSVATNQATNASKPAAAAPK